MSRSFLSHQIVPIDQPNAHLSQQERQHNTTGSSFRNPQIEDIARYPTAAPLTDAAYRASSSDSVGSTSQNVIRTLRDLGFSVIGGWLDSVTSVSNHIANIIPLAIGSDFRFRTETPISGLVTSDQADLAAALNAQRIGEKFVEVAMMGLPVLSGARKASTATEAVRPSTSRTLIGQRSRPTDSFVPVSRSQPSLQPPPTPVSSSSPVVNKYSGISGPDPIKDLNLNLLTLGLHWEVIKCGLATPLASLISKRLQLVREYIENAPRAHLNPTRYEDLVAHIEHWQSEVEAVLTETIPEIGGTFEARFNARVVHELKHELAEIREMLSQYKSAFGVEK